MNSDKDNIRRYWVAPFGDFRIKSCSHFPGTYRRVPRPSSPLIAKASTRCPFLSWFSMRMWNLKKSHTYHLFFCKTDDTQSFVSLNSLCLLSTRIRWYIAILSLQILYKDLIYWINQYTRYTSYLLCLTTPWIFFKDGWKRSWPLKPSSTFGGGKEIRTPDP